MSARKHKYKERHALVNVEKQETHVSFEICCFLILKISFSWLREVKKTRKCFLYPLHASLHIGHKA